MAAKPKLLTKAAYAAHRGVNASQVTRYTQRGMPCHLGMIDAAEADAWCARNLDPTKPKSKVTAEQRAQVSVATVPTPDLTTRTPPARKRHPEPSDGSVPDLNNARAWDTHWSARRREQQVEEFDRSHIAIGEVESLLDLISTSFWQGLEGVSGRIASQIAATCGGDVAVIGEIIRDEHRLVRESVARAIEGFADAEANRTGPQSSEIDPAATETLDGRVGSAERYPSAEVC